MILTIILFLIILGVLVFVHELGHFVVARRNGVKAEEFGFGFPPRACGFYKKNGRWIFVWGNREIKSENTVYSLNWIPLGGFVKIKGENGGDVKEIDSFVSKKPWVRIKILAAGVLMNFLLAWFLLWGAMLVGIPEVIDDGGINPDSKIQIAQVVKGTPAEEAGLKVGDEILKSQQMGSGKVYFINLEKVQEFVGENKGREISLQIKRGKEVLNVKVVPRKDVPEGQGPLGISMAETAKVRYSLGEAFWKSFLSVFEFIWAMVAGLFLILKQIITGGGSVGAEIDGPVGIAIMTKQVAELGLVYILQFAAILSINLGIINALPVPALDGGRILFILIEKIKGSPVTQKTEQIFHTVGFLLLVSLMILVTFKDVWKLLR